jgi:4-hydroxy-3-methylbut-2-enyl diphosphate reductase
MVIEIDPHSGFCFGVVRAIELAEQELAQCNQLLCLGDIVHNGAEVQRLENSGLHTIYYDDMYAHPSERILFRAHGEPPATYEAAKKLGMQIIDATCPVVLKLQQKVKRTGALLKPQGGQIIIFGKPDHAEVNGLCGQTDCEVFVVQTLEDLVSIDLQRPTACFSQTTMSAREYKKITTSIEVRMRELLGNGELPLTINASTCAQVANRHESLAKFAKEHDAILFVSGKKSSNGKMLYQECRNVNPRTYFTTGTEPIIATWLDSVERLGICGATSTPRWLMEALANRILQEYTK